ncbi:exopolysaccharide biosynthesis protein [Qingshengfaniella alkalisoli]|uniref:exopolysaccharide biosynthesis protein n=1 Tax=Qingshengfaniella alkalisoli TaxID=2599296 RepID=UPI001F0E686B|nr:exopolysaccharide biosynthesis protein [Qingshengfaniella alkalisoli]
MLNNSQSSVQPAPEVDLPQSLDQLLDCLDRAADQEDVSFGDMIEAVGERSFAPVLLVPALAVVTPLSGIPLFSSLCGISIALVSLQSLLGRRHLWLPDWITSRSTKGQRVRNAIDWMRKPARWLDSISRDRLTLLVRRPSSWVVFVLCLICGALMPFLELVPFSSSILGGAVSLFAFAILVGDGLIAVLACLFVMAGFSVPYLVFAT